MSEQMRSTVPIRRRTPSEDESSMEDCGPSRIVRGMLSGPTPPELYPATWMKAQLVAGISLRITQSSILCNSVLIACEKYSFAWIQSRSRAKICGCETSMELTQTMAKVQLERLQPNDQCWACGAKACVVSRAYRVQTFMQRQKYLKRSKKDSNNLRTGTVPE